MNKGKLVVIGAGGHVKVVIDNVLSGNIDRFEILKLRRKFNL